MTLRIGSNFCQFVCCSLFTKALHAFEREFYCRIESIVSFNEGNCAIGDGVLVCKVEADSHFCQLQQADVYAFGVLLVEMYCGERAYEGKRHPQILHLIAILKQHPQLPDSAPTFLIVSL